MKLCKYPRWKKSDAYSGSQEQNSFQDINLSYENTPSNRPPGLGEMYLVEFALS